MAYSNDCPRLSIGVDFGTAYTAVVIRVLCNNGEGSNGNISSVVHAFKVLSFGDQLKLDMTFGRKLSPNGTWAISLADELDDIAQQDRLRYLKFAVHGMDTGLTLDIADAEDLTVARSPLSAPLHAELRTSTLTTVKEELQRVAASVSPHEVISKAMVRIWNRHVWPAVQNWADTVQVAAEQIKLEITIGFPGIWSKEKSRQYGQLLLSSVPLRCTGNLSMIEEGHATLIGACLVNKQLALEAGKVYTIFDAGGGTVDATSCLVVCRDPLVLRPLFPADQGRSDWFGSDTIMIRYLRLLNQMIPFLMEQNLDEGTVQEAISQMMMTLREHTHKLQANSSSDGEREVRLTHGLLSRQMPENRAMYEAAGINLENIERQEIILTGSLTKAVVDYTIEPAILLLMSHVKEVLNFCREHREYKHSGVLVTSGGFCQNRYFQDLIHRSVYTASNGQLKGDKIFDCSKEKATLAIGAAHFAEADRANSGRFVHCRLGIVSAVELPKSDQQMTLWTKTEAHPTNCDLLWMQNLFLWAVEGGLIRGCAKLVDGTFAFNLACADINTKQDSLSDLAWSPLTSVFISAAHNPINCVVQGPEVRVSFSGKEMDALRHLGMVKGNSGVVFFGVRLRWIGGRVGCLVQVPLTSIDDDSSSKGNRFSLDAFTSRLMKTDSANKDMKRRRHPFTGKFINVDSPGEGKKGTVKEPLTAKSFDDDSFNKGDCICKTAYIDMEPEPELLNLTSLFEKSTIGN